MKLDVKKLSVMIAKGGSPRHNMEEHTTNEMYTLEQQSMPFIPGAHEQLYVLIPSIHLDPLQQLLLRQSSISKENKVSSFVKEESKTHFTAV